MNRSLTRGKVFLLFFITASQPFFCAFAANNRGGTAPACETSKHRGEIDSQRVSGQMPGEGNLLYLRGDRHGESLVLSLAIDASNLREEIVGLDVYSEPSHTHLLSVFSDKYPRFLLDVIRALTGSTPKATVMVDMDLAGPRVKVGMPAKTDDGRSPCAAGGEAYQKRIGRHQASLVR